MKRYGSRITGSNFRIHGCRCPICCPDKGSKRSARREAKESIRKELIIYYEEIKEGGNHMGS